MTNPSQQPNYSGKFSSIYDLFYAHKTYAHEADFVHTLLLRFGKQPAQKILELGCGTGTHSFLLEKKGHEIVGTDLSPDMISKAKIKAETMGSKISFFAQDMLQLDQPARPFDAVICLFDSICYVTGNADFETLLTRIHAHLKPGGLFIFEFWNAAAMIQHLDRSRRGCTTRNMSTSRFQKPTWIISASFIKSPIRSSRSTPLVAPDLPKTSTIFQVQEMAYFLT